MKSELCGRAKGLGSFHMHKSIHMFARVEAFQDNAPAQQGLRHTSMKPHSLFTKFCVCEVDILCVFVNRTLHVHIYKCVNALVPV